MISTFLISNLLGKSVFWTSYRPITPCRKKQINEKKSSTQNRAGILQVKYIRNSWMISYTIKTWKLIKKDVG